MGGEGNTRCGGTSWSPCYPGFAVACRRCRSSLQTFGRQSTPLALIAQEPLGFFALGLQSLTCILLEELHLLPSHKRLLDLWTTKA